MARILLVNDSSLVRQLVTRLLADQPGIEGVATASNGELALRQLALMPFDLVLLDFEMPVMNGLETLAVLRREYPRLPVLMLSRYTVQGAEVTVEALMRGAADYLTLPDEAAVDGLVRSRLQSDLLSKIQRLQAKPPANTRALPPHMARPDAKMTVLAIGSSTGGPRVLEQILCPLPRDFPVPVLIVQHIAVNFIQVLADSLGRKCSLPVRVAEHQHPVLAGEILLAPGAQHLQVMRRDKQLMVELDQGPQENSCRPSVDVLFRSLAEAYGSGVLALVLTGMGTDGLAGARAIAAKGGQVLVQDQATSVVWGMPGVIAQAGLADGILTPDDLAREVLARARKVTGS
ncbi:MAG: chemotaxis-specific protein-glutamate methyltransferase CheB [Candidatus Sericytochromatia bacterium]